MLGILKRVFVAILLNGLLLAQGILYPNGAKHPTTEISVFFGSPENSTAPDYCHFFTAFGSGCPLTGIFNQSNVTTYLTGMTSTIPIGCNGGNISTVTCFEDGTNCPAYIFNTGSASPDSLFNTLTTANAALINNLIISGASYLNNAATPQYWGTQAWANAQDYDCVHNDSSLTWSASTWYLPGSVILDSGNYFQMQVTTCSNSDTNDIRCKSGAAKPNFASGCAVSCTDGSGGNQATWTNMGANAPPLDYFCDANSTGNNQENCYQLRLSGAASVTSGGVATVTVTNPPTYPNGQALVVSQVTPSYYNCPSGCVVVSTTATTVVYSGLAHTQHLNDTITPPANSNCPGTGSGGFAPCMFGSHTLNIKTPNATAAILANQQPVVWEQVYRESLERAFNSIATHYTTGGNPSLGYIRVGCTKAGECNQSNINLWPCGSSSTTCSNAVATKLYVSYEKELYCFMGGVCPAGGTQQPGISSVLCGGTSPATFACVGNLNSSPAIEGPYAQTNNIGGDNNAMGANHAYTLDFYQVLGNSYPPAGKLYHGGDWALEYATTFGVALPNTYFPVLTLQTTQESTPGSNPGTCTTGTCSGGSCTTTGVTGAISRDPLCTTNLTVFPLPNAYPGILPLMTQYLANNIEMYPCDALIILDTAYATTHNCPAIYDQTVYQPRYQAAAVNFLAGTTGAPVFETAASVSFSINTVSTFNCGTLSTPLASFTETGSMPTGLTFTDNGNGTCTIAGTPTVSGVTTITINATNSISTTHQTFVITVLSQNIQGTGSGSGTFVISYTNSSTPANYPALPLKWAEDREWNPAFTGASYDVTKTMGTDYALTSAGCNAAIAAWVAAPDQWWHVIIPHGSVLPQTAVCTLLGKVGATKFMVWDTDTPLTANQTVCSHKIVDNNDGSSPRNLGCTNDVGSMGTVEGRFSPGNNGLLFTACTIHGTNCLVGPNHYAFHNLELRPQSGQNQGKTYLFQLDDGDTSGTLGSNHIWFIGDYFHGDAGDSQPSGSNLISAAVNWTSCSYCGFAYNYVDQIASIGNEDHILQVTWSPGPSKFVGNWFEGSSINWLTGGATVTVQPYENVYDVEIRGNRFTKPSAWMTIPTTGVGSVALNLKSDLECKTCTRVLIDGNIFEYSSTNGAQKGQCLTLTPRNVASGGGGDNYQNAVQDITITDNICRHAVTGIEASARSDGTGSGNGATQPSRRWNVKNNLFYDISPGTATIFNSSVAQPFVMEVGGGGNSWTCTASRDGTGTIATLTCADGGVGLHQTTMNVGDFVNVTSCSDTSFNTPTHGGLNQYAGKGPAALAGTVPTGLTVVYPSTGTANATATGCVVSNSQGFPQAYTFRHNSVFGAYVGSAGGAGVLPSCLTIDVYAQNATFQDNLIALPSSYSGTLCQGNGNTEGTVSQTDLFDSSTLTFNFNGIANRNASVYSDYPGGVTPSVANWFPTNVVCSSGTANSGCFGFTGMMNGAAYEPNATLYTDYSLVSSSLFKAGGSQQADDATDNGANITTINAALTLKQYVCPYFCGSGPLPNF